MHGRFGPFHAVPWLVVGADAANEPPSAGSKDLLQPLRALQQTTQRLAPSRDLIR